MLIVIRVDASDRIGTGHVTRCLALADVLRERGDQVHFVCRRHVGHLIGHIESRGYAVSALPAPSAPIDGAGEDYRAFLGVSPLADAAEMIDSLDGRRPDWLIVDHYALDRVWEQQLQPQAAHLLVIDDLADRAHDCELLLDQTYATAPERRYDGLVPRRCEVLSGPRFALLSPEYAAHRRGQRDGQRAPSRVLVYFGGSDLGNVTGLVLTVLSAPEFSHLEADVVIGANNPHRPALERQASARPRTRVHGMRPHLADLMAGSDVAIGAGGVTTWERMCVGVPALVVCLAQNQRPTCDALSAAGLIQYVGEASRVGAADIATGLNELLTNTTRVLAMASNGQNMVDGRGAQRVAAAMRPHHPNSEAR